MKKIFPLFAKKSIKIINPMMGDKITSKNKAEVKSTNGLNIVRYIL